MPRATTQPKGPGGRPKKAEHERAVAALHADVTLADKKYVRDQAKLAGITEAEYIRRRCLGLPVVVRQSKSDARLVHEINAVGVNLHQYIRDDRFGRGSRSPQDWDQLYDRLRMVLDKALDALDD